MTMQLFLRFSGVLAMLTAWFLVVAPALFYGIDKKKQTITIATCFNSKVSRTVTFGLIMGAFLQSFFFFYLVQRFQIPLFGIGSFLYLTSNLATILVALFHYKKHKKIHNFFTVYYFVSNPLALGLIAYSALAVNSNLFLFSFFLILGYFLGQGVILKKYKSGAYPEIWAFLMLSIWTTVATFI